MARSSIALFRFALLGALLVTSASRVSSQTEVSDLVARDDRPLERSGKAGVVSYASSLREARPAVVSIYAQSKLDLDEEDKSLLEELFGPDDPHHRSPFFGLGSGVIVSENGYILTNSHVVSSADEIRVQLDDRRIYEAELVGNDPQTDIAVVKIDATGLPAITLTDSDATEVGDVVFAIGNPLGVGKTVTMGIVSATKRQQMGVIAGGFEDFIQTDASINTGNSGGALVDAYGRLIGINTLIQTDGRSSGNIGIGFAVPINLAYAVMSDLVSQGAVSRGFLGVAIQGLNQERAEELGLASLDGARVTQVNRGSPAASAGIEVGDVIVEVDGETVATPSDLRLKIARKKPAQRVEIALMRDGERLVVSAILGQREEELAALEQQGSGANERPPERVPSKSLPESGFLDGIFLEALSGELRARYDVDEGVEGVVVVSVDKDSPYASDLPEGMVIQKVNGRKASSVEEAGAALNYPGMNSLQVSYRGVYRWVTLTVDP